MVSRYTPPNYLKSRELSSNLCEKIVEFYRNNPAYPEGFYKKIQTYIYRNPTTGDFYVRSNLGELFANIVDLEEKYGCV